MVNLEAWRKLIMDFTAKGVTLIAVSKTKPVSAIQELYDAGQRDFGENYVQELVEKQPILPDDIRWHFIGHLQSNKVKYIAPFVHLIHAVDNIGLLNEINKQGQKYNRVIDVLLQMYIASEETKYGMDEEDIAALLLNFDPQQMTNIRICGLMGMATFTDDIAQIKNEFNKLHSFFTRLAATAFLAKPEFKICSMGMSADYEMAIEAGSNMVRIGSLLFGARG